MRWAPVVSIQMERTRPHLTKGARVDEKTNEVQTSLRVDQNQDKDKDKDKNKNKNMIALLSLLS